MSEDILAGLNPAQLEAVTTTEGPVLILAGAGSGKTKALTHRLAYLICQIGIHPQNILAVTFTNKAAQEMVERIHKLLTVNREPLTEKSDTVNRKLTTAESYQSTVNGQRLITIGQRFAVNGKLPWMGTFHAICAKILRFNADKIGFTRSFIIYDEDESLTAIKHAMDAVGVDKKQFNPKAIKNYISGAKNELMSPSEYAKYSRGYFGEVVIRVYEQYEKELKNANAFDFDDLLKKTVELLENNPDVLEYFQNLFHYILIDEYQDTNRAQYQLVKLLAARRQNICVVGDDFQSIYSFRGANFKNILDFEKDYPQAKIIKMEQNYRSTQNIINAAQKVIEHNLMRTDKELWTENPVGAPATIYQAQNEIDEVEFIISEIEALNRFHTLNDFVVLYRTNAQSRILEEIFIQHKIPYRLIGALRFYDRREVKDILAYLKLIVNARDKVSLKRVINVPTRGIGDKTSKILDPENPKVKKFFEMMDELREDAKKLKPAELIEQILFTTGYKKYILDGTEEGESRWENIEELKSVAQKAETLEQFLENVALVADIDALDKSVEAVTFMTMHNAKGLEYPVVFIVGLEEGLFPHANSLMEPAELEEERRLCYVAMTRARERLYLSYTLTRLLFGSISSNLPSRFLSEIPEDLVERI